MTNVTIIVEPIWDRPGHFEARFDGHLLARSRQPLLDAARKLLELGHSPHAQGRHDLHREGGGQRLGADRRRGRIDRQRRGQPLAEAQALEAAEPGGGVAAHRAVGAGR
jgi:hypothetical protein